MRKYRKDIVTNLLKLTSINIASGQEEKFYDWICGQFTDYKFKKDHLGNVWKIKKSRKKRKYRILLSAHVDEVCMIVDYIDKNIIYAKMVGRINKENLKDQEVEIETKRSLIDGRISEIGENYVMIYLHSQKELSLVEEGNRVFFKQKYKELDNNLLRSKALDNRIGVYIILNLMKVDFDNIEMTYLYSAKEEIGLCGAEGKNINSRYDLAIVIDTTYGTREGKIRVGNGAVIAIGPILDSRFTQKIKEVAIKNHIKHQYEIEPRKTGTEAWAYNKKGIRTVLFSVAIENMHSANEIASIEDISNTIILLKKFLKKIDNSP